MERRSFASFLRVANVVRKEVPKNNERDNEYPSNNIATCLVKYVGRNGALVSHFDKGVAQL